jgi:Putative transposase
VEGYRSEGPERYKVTPLDTSEFVRRFLMHALPQGFHRIRYYGLLTSQIRAKNIACARELLAVPLIPIDAIKAASATPEEPKAPEHPCPCCGSPMLIISSFHVIEGVAHTGSLASRGVPGGAEEIRHER